MEFAECFAQSAFSFHEGASLPEEMLESAEKLQLRALGLCDRGGVYGMVRAWKSAKERQIPLLHGTLLDIDKLPELGFLAENEQGWSDVCELITQAHALTPKGIAQLQATDLFVENREVLVLADWKWCTPERETKLAMLVEHYPDRVFLVATRQFVPEDQRRMRHIIRSSQRFNLPIVASARPLQHHPKRQHLQDVLQCIRLKTTLDKAGTRLHPNAERHLQSGLQIAQKFPNHPDWIQQSLVIVERCQFTLDQLHYTYPKEVVPSPHTPMSWLRNRTLLGLKTRYPNGTPPGVRTQVEHELTLIEALDFPAYFLTVYDIVRMARERGILCQGRGSAANSAVCFALGITSVDPSQSHMLFERFISKERGEPPDIDVDFEHERREEIIQAIYLKYGRERAAMVNAVISYRPRSAIRDAGKTLGLSLDQVARLAKGIERWKHIDIDDTEIQKLGLNPEDPRVRHCLRLSQELLGLPRHVSIHSGGFVIADSSLKKRVPIEPASMPGRTVIQWDKDDIDALGFIKLDCLALGMLSAIQKSFTLIEEHHHRSLNLANVPQEDPDVYAMCSRGETIGVFQIESRAQMSMLPRMRPQCFYDLIIEVSIVRPGPIQGGMIHPYLNRRNGKEPIIYAHPSLKPILERTLGVPIFQEQVMEMAMTVGGFSAGEADQLRRAMGAWRKNGGLKPLIQRLGSNMRKRGICPEYADQIAKQILGFGEYGFPESHAASFALIVYVSAWLKHHYPDAFTVALLNSQPMGFYSPASLVKEARRQGVEVRPTCAFQSQWNATLEATSKSKHHAIRLGLRQIKGFQKTSAEKLIDARKRCPIGHKLQILQNASLHKDELLRLARADAFSGANWSRREAIWQIQGLWSGPLIRTIDTPKDNVRFTPPDQHEAVQLDFQHLGLSLKSHPIELSRVWLQKEGASTILDLSNKPSGSRVLVAGLVTHRQRPHTASGVIFLGVEDETGILNIVVWPKVYARQRSLIRHQNMLLIEGKLQKEREAISVIAYRFHTLSEQTINTKSRDFQ